MAFSKLEIFGIVKINKFLNFFQFVKQKFSNFEIFQPFKIPHYSQFCQFSYSPIDINQLSQFLFSILVTHKFGYSAFEHLLIFEFKTSAILKFYCLKFWPSTAISKFRNISRSTLGRSKFRPPPFWTSNPLKFFYQFFTAKWITTES